MGKYPQLGPRIALNRPELFVTLLIVPAFKFLDTWGFGFVVSENILCFTASRVCIFACFITESHLSHFFFLEFLNAFLFLFEER